MTLSIRLCKFITITETFSCLEEPVLDLTETEGIWDKKLNLETEKQNKTVESHNIANSITIFYKAK